MAHTVTPARRLAATGVLLLGGGAITIGAWAGGQTGFAIGLVIFYVVAGIITYAWTGGRSDTAAIMSVSGDERQRMIDLRATAVSGLTAGIFCVGGTVVDLARGGTGYPWAMICAVIGLSYATSIGVAVFRGRQ